MSSPRRNATPPRVPTWAITWDPVGVHVAGGEVTDHSLGKNHRIVCGFFCWGIFLAPSRIRMAFLKYNLWYTHGPEVPNVLKEKIPQASWMFLSLAHIEFIHIKMCRNGIIFHSLAESEKFFSTLHMLHWSYTYTCCGKYRLQWLYLLL